MLYRLPLYLAFICISGCRAVPKIGLLPKEGRPGGSAFYERTAAMNSQQRDSVVLEELEAGNLPAFLYRLVPVTVHATDSTTGRHHTLTYFVTPDYFSIGNSADWARVPVMPGTAQQIADKLDCILPTRKMTDDIYRAATVKLAPVPMYALRDSTPTCWQHHLIIEGQRQGRTGLIAGIKKDIVSSPALLQDKRKNRVAIYGWHRLNGIPIQPLYTGHVDWYVDYSHGLRLVAKRMRLDKKWVDCAIIFNDPQLRKLVSDEPGTGIVRYPVPGQMN